MVWSRRNSLNQTGNVVLAFVDIYKAKPKRFELLPTSSSKLSRPEAALGVRGTYFAFVREPMERFLSGYDEATLYTHKMCCLRDPRKKGETQEWHVARLSLHRLHHAEAGALRAYGDRMTFVGRVERLVSDWDELSRRTGGFAPPYSALINSLGQHESSLAKSGRRSALRALLEEDVPLRAALDELLHIDFACFGYPHLLGRET
ncbi:hypothetical protein EMIHUDRAFT_209834 [Emiliania huxleyi CCMP1516]|uniref:Sulfotransferase family protein n=2 Tax=Emiliania huxleyi TaxID=2903 RepID=A0A0D3J2V1_EMIH1|nr:hypothetical protein EMIHUDRAFT_209834 [Emiliania huxleyi CCMP1516]EOD17836.1 hypothetical protein EMIHUDRAFT_209834 [Emiliania huxleyi CCMP1516]|eukprot:XP_005770265.1 hypothetical protein EMIHUDRAFT_209834 [Emiliania huxleyi CCMP1516]